jgi:hypothetical protein
MLFYGNLFFQGETATNGCDALEIKTLSCKTIYL